MPAAGFLIPPAQDPGVLALLAGLAPLASPTFTGTVSGITAAMVGLGNVNNTADTAKPISSLTQAALDLKAPLASPALSGVPTAPTAAADTNTTQLATTAFVLGQAYTSNPAANGTASAGNSTRWARGNHVHPTDTTRAPLASPTFTGTPAAPTAAASTSTTQLATTAFTQAAIAAAGTFTDTSTTAGVVFYNQTLAQATFTAATTNQPIRFASASRMIWNSTSNASGVTHFGGSMSWVIVNGSGNPAFVLGGEDKVEINRAGTVGLVKGREVQLAANVAGSTLTFYAGITSQILANAGTITTAVLHDSDVPANTGTITTLIDYWSRDISGRSGIGSRYGFRNDDAGKLNTSASGWIDQSVQYATPTNGGTTTITGRNTWLVLGHGATIASHTIAFPAASTLQQGEVFEISTNQPITALTLTCSGATFIVWAGGSLSAGQTIRFRWDAVNGWLRSMSQY